MNDFIDLPHLPECLLGLPLETIHEIHSHTYHAIKADRKQRGELVVWPKLTNEMVECGAMRRHEWDECESIQDVYDLFRRQWSRALSKAPQPAAPVPESDYAALEKEHLGCPEKSTGIYAAPAQEPSVPEGWRIVERRTCYALHQGNEVIALLSGPRAEDNAALLAGLLARYGQQTATPEGWKLVPVEPTEEMMAAFADAVSPEPSWADATEDDRQSVRVGFVPLYQAMLTAAPKFGGGNDGSF